MEMELEGHRAVLLPEKALWLPDEKTLIIADVHWGKAGHFRKHGMAIPQQVNNNNAQRLSGLIQETGAETILFAGDLFHSRHNSEVKAFCVWRASFSAIKMQLVVGNHDILGADFYVAAGLEVFPERRCIGNLCILHDKPEKAEKFVVHGHIHPGIKLHGRGRQTLALSCFAMDTQRLILPAFGAFTGCFYLDKTDFTQLYAVAGREVIRVK